MYNIIYKFLVFLVSFIFIQFQTSAQELDRFDSVFPSRQPIYNFFENKPELVVSHKAEQDLNQEQKELAEKYEKQKQRYSLLQHKIFENDRIRIFNNTAFGAENLKNDIRAGHYDFNNLDQLEITMGYGIEFILDQENIVGYEYLSSFPYDRGQILRIFWNKKF